MSFNYGVQYRIIIIVIINQQNKWFTTNESTSNKAISTNPISTSYDGDSLYSPSPSSIDRPSNQKRQLAVSTVRVAIQPPIMDLFTPFTITVDRPVNKSKSVISRSVSISRHVAGSRQPTAAAEGNKAWSSGKKERQTDRSAGRMNQWQKNTSPGDTKLCCRPVRSSPVRSGPVQSSPVQSSDSSPFSSIRTEPKPTTSSY